MSSISYTMRPSIEQSIHRNLPVIIGESQGGLIFSCPAIILTICFFDKYSSFPDTTLFSSDFKFVNHVERIYRLPFRCFSELLKLWQLLRDRILQINHCLTLLSSFLLSSMEFFWRCSWFIFVIRNVGRILIYIFYTLCYKYTTSSAILPNNLLIRLLIHLNSSVLGGATNESSNRMIYYWFHKLSFFRYLLRFVPCKKRNVYLAFNFVIFFIWHCIYICYINLKRGDRIINLHRQLQSHKN